MFTITPYTQTRKTPAKKGTPATKPGDQLWRITWEHPDFGTLQFCWQYISKEYAQHVADRMALDGLNQGSIEANWRKPHSDRFYVTGRTQD